MTSYICTHLSSRARIQSARAHFIRSSSSIYRTKRQVAMAVKQINSLGKLTISKQTFKLNSDTSALLSELLTHVCVRMHTKLSFVLCSSHLKHLYLPIATNHHIHPTRYRINFTTIGYLGNGQYWMNHRRYNSGLLNVFLPLKFPIILTFVTLSMRTWPTIVLPPFCFAK